PQLPLGRLPRRRRAQRHGESHPLVPAPLPLRSLRTPLFSDAMADCLAPETLPAEHLSIARTAQQFWTAEVAPNLAAIHRQDPGVLLKVLRKSADLGFTGISVPERFGGMELD